MLNLTVEAIKDYQTCALLYDYRHRQELTEPIQSRELMAQRYENTLRRVISFFFYKRQGGITPSYNALVHRWEKLWFPKDMTAYDLAVEQHESAHGNYASYSNMAISSLIKFYEDFSKKIGDPILLDEKFHVPLTKTIKIEGRFDLVLQLKNDFYVIKWLTKSRRMNLSGYMMDFAVLRHAFEYRNQNRDYTVNYFMYDVGSPTPGFIDADPSIADLNALRFWATEMEEAKAFVPRRGLTAYCKKCPFDRPCSKFELTQEMFDE